jgi:hypothetical protein
MLKLAAIASGDVLDRAGRPSFWLQQIRTQQL